VGHATPPKRDHTTIWREICGTSTRIHDRFDELLCNIRVSMAQAEKMSALPASEKVRP